MAMEALEQWRGRLEKRVWQRVVRKGTVLKELNECAPVMARTKAMVDEMELKGDEKCVILDLCSGFGYMGMFMSEILPAHKVHCTYFDHPRRSVYSKRTLHPSHSIVDAVVSRKFSSVSQLCLYLISPSQSPHKC